VDVNLIPACVTRLLAVWEDEDEVEVEDEDEMKEVHLSF
jgi:hypothetical protein